tara:strand:+ start:13 stop:513 length:501 start_codon:yes stop_codon:yes gene_type:complete
MKKHYVYKHTENNEIIYIGSGTHGRAWESRKRNKDHMNWMNHNMIYNNASGIEIIKVFNKLENCLNYEESLIRKNNPKYNLRFSNSELGIKYKQDCGNSRRGKKMPKEFVEAQSKRMKGELNPMFKKKFSKEHIRKMSESRKGKKPWNAGLKFNGNCSIDNINNIT